MQQAPLPVCWPSPLRVPRRHRMSGGFCCAFIPANPYSQSPSPTIVINPDYCRPPTATIVIHERWRPVERFTREYVVRDYGGFDDPEW